MNAAGMNAAEMNSAFFCKGEQTNTLTAKKASNDKLKRGNFLKKKQERERAKKRTKTNER